MPKRIDELQRKTNEAYRQVRDELERAGQRLEQRIERMREKVAEHEQRRPLKAVTR